MISTVKSINHIALACEDLNNSLHLFQYVFDAELLKSTEEEQFLKLGDFCVVLIKGKRLEKSYNHIAFQVETEELSKFQEKLKNLNLVILQGKDRMMGKNNSLYFYDYDNHLFELHTGDLQITLYTPNNPT